MKGKLLYAILGVALLRTINYTNKPIVVVTPPGAAQEQDREPPKIDLQQVWKYYREHRGRRAYGNKADFHALSRLFLGFRMLGYNKPETVVLVGGTNQGQSSLNILKLCPQVAFYGFEIQPSEYQVAKTKLAGYTGATLINKGWSEQKADAVPIGGPAGESAGLYDPQGQREWYVQQGVTASTVRLDEWTKENGIAQTAFVLIDTEGHEPKVIRSMGLEKDENRQKFPLFQFEELFESEFQPLFSFL